MKTTNNTTKLITPLTIAFLVLSPVCMAGAADSAFGLFQTEPGDTGGYLHVRIGPCAEDADRVCGVIESAFEEGGTDSPEYEHLGKQMLWEMVDQGSGKYSKGKIWAPDRDKTYRSKMQVTEDGLKVKGCVGPICRSQKWVRVD